MKITAMEYNAVSAGLLLFITATANVKLMLIVSVIGFLMGLKFLRDDREQSGVLAVTIGYFFVFSLSVIWLVK